jgi:hypothetical protein
MSEWIRQRISDLYRLKGDNGSLSQHGRIRTAASWHYSSGPNLDSNLEQNTEQGPTSRWKPALSIPAPTQPGLLKDPAHHGPTRLSPPRAYTIPFFSLCLPQGVIVLP